MATRREALIASAEKSLLKGKVEAALKDYLKVLEETPSDINILNKAGDLNVRLGRNDESIIHFLRIAEFYARDGFYVRSIAMYKKINKLDPARLDVYEKLAELYVKQQLWMEAKSNYKVLADHLLKQDNLGGAIGIYQKMVAIEPQNVQLHVELADLFAQAKRIPEALREYGVLAGALAERGALEESIRVYEKALRLAPDNVEILRTLVPLLLSIDSVDSARAVLRKGLDASPRSVPLFLLAADAALAANEMAEARSFSDKARAVEPDNEDALAATVRIQLKGGRPDLAWAAAGPLADAAVRRGEAKKALGILVPIARAAPDVDELVRKIVDIASGIGDEATALPFRSALAELYRRKGKLAEAADLLRHCVRIQPDNAEFRSRLAQFEPCAGENSVAPAPAHPSMLERQMEVLPSGFKAPLARAAVQPPARPRAPAPPPPVVIPQAVQSSDEFEFDFDDGGTIETPGEVFPVAKPLPPPTPRRGIAAPRKTAPVTGPADANVPIWGSLTAAEALEAHEALQAKGAVNRALEIPKFLEEDVFGLGSSHGSSLPSHEAIVTALLGDPVLLARVLGALKGSAEPGTPYGPRPDDEMSSRFALRVETSYPTPVAAPWAAFRRLRTATEPTVGTRLLVHVFEGLLKLLSAVGLAVARGAGKAVSLPESQLHQFTRSSPSAGTLFEVARRSAEAVAPDGPGILLLLVEDFFRKQLIEAVELRNRAVHDGAPAADHRDFRIAVVRLLHRLEDHLGRSYLFVPDYVRTGQGLEVVECRLYRGALALPERASFKTDRAFRTGTPYIQFPDDPTILPLSPFYLHSRCELEGCGEEHLFEWTGSHRRRLKYRAPGLLEKHQLDSSDPSDGLRESLDAEWQGAVTVAPERFFWIEEGGADLDVRRKGSALGRFEIVEHLGRGGVADVYGVRDRVSGEERAVKLLSYKITRDRQVLARLRREYREMRRIHHANVVRVEELGEDRGDHFLIEELAPGWKEGARLARDLSLISKPVPWQLAIRIVEQVAEGLAAVHAMGIVHRDLKPSNLLLFPPSCVKIGDFGVSRSTIDDSMTMTGVAIGTPNYMSPEQAEDGKVDGRSDLYSLGVILFELLSGQLPFRASNSLQMMKMHRETAPPQLSKLVSELPSELVGLVSTLLSKRPDQRLHSAKALVNRLREIH